MYLSVLSQLGLKQTDFNQKVEKLVSNLKDNNKNLEAAIVYEQYLNVCLKTRLLIMYRLQFFLLGLRKRD
jgi:hypothetical protein